jgi:DnaJ-class molecular chaperone
MARKAKTTAEQKDDREAAWKEMSTDNRASWMLAYYAENSGDFEVDPKPTFSACRDCGGEGTRTTSLAGANVSRSTVGKGLSETKVECETCHGLGVVRRISYR